MAKLDLLARLGGADPSMLADNIASQTGERNRFVAMGGVLLTTAGVATVSMFFALHHGVGVTTGWSIPFALAWGVVIINIDRFLITTLTGSRRHPLRVIVTVLIRVMLAALIAIVVATPLVLQIFHSDISAALPVVQEQQSATFVQNQAHDAAETQLAKDNAAIKAEQAVADGTGQIQLAADHDAVNTLNGEVNAARSKVSTAFAKWQCELGGLSGTECPPGTSGLVGNGPLAKADHEAYENDVAAYSSLNSELTTAKNNLAADTSAAGDSESTARQQVTKLTNEVNALRTTIAAGIANDNSKNTQDTGLLEQIHALFTASATDSALAWAHWIVTALFFVIEILPVTIKCLLLLGGETPYEKIVQQRGDAAVAQTGVTLDAEMDVVRIRAQSMRDIAVLQAQADRDVREAALQSDLAIAQDKEQARQRVETDLTSRERGIRIEANKRFASATRDHILAAIDDWAHQIREAIRLGSQPPSVNGKTPQPAGQGTAGNNGQNPPGGNGPTGGVIL
jgi:hypothetical protein